MSYCIKEWIQKVLCDDISHDVEECEGEGLLQEEEHLRCRPQGNLIYPDKGPILFQSCCCLQNLLCNVLGCIKDQR